MQEPESEATKRNEHKSNITVEENTLPHIIRFLLSVLSQIAFQPFFVPKYMRIILHITGVFSVRQVEDSKLNGLSAKYQGIKDSARQFVVTFQ